jgi:hypothetical protein
MDTWTVWVCMRQPATTALTGTSTATLSADGQQVTVSFSVTNPNTVEATAFTAQLAATGVTGTPVSYGPVNIPAGQTIGFAQTFPVSNTGLPTFTISNGQATVAGSTITLSPATITATVGGHPLGACVAFVAGRGV